MYKAAATRTKWDNVFKVLSQVRAWPTASPTNGRCHWPWYSLNLCLFEIGAGKGPSLIYSLRKSNELLDVAELWCVCFTNASSNLLGLSGKAVQMLLCAFPGGQQQSQVDSTCPWPLLIMDDVETGERKDTGKILKLTSTYKFYLLIILFLALLRLQWSPSSCTGRWGILPKINQL